MSFSRDISDYPDGIILAVDKPYRWTSADVIRKLKYAAIRQCLQTGAGAAGAP